MDKKQIIEVYQRYVTSLKGEESDIIKNFQAMYQWLKQNCEDKDIWVTLNYGMIAKSIQEAERSELNFKDSSQGQWNGSLAKMGYQLARATSKALDEGDRQKSVNCLVELYKLISEVADIPALQLYICRCYYLTETGQSFFNRMEKDANQMIKELAL